MSIVDSSPSSGCARAAPVSNTIIPTESRLVGRLNIRRLCVEMIAITISVAVLTRYGGLSRDSHAYLQRGGHPASAIVSSEPRPPAFGALGERFGAFTNA